MPYKDKNKSREAWRKWYQKSKEIFNWIIFFLLFFVVIPAWDKTN